MTNVVGNSVIVTCPSCTKRYMLDHRVLDRSYQEGTPLRFRCNHCSHVWQPDSKDITQGTSPENLEPASNMTSGAGLSGGLHEAGAVMSYGTNPSPPPVRDDIPASVENAASSTQEPSSREIPSPSNPSSETQAAKEGLYSRPPLGEPTPVKEYSSGSSNVSNKILIAALIALLGIVYMEWDDIYEMLPNFDFSPYEDVKESPAPPTNFGPKDPHVLPDKGPSETHEIPQVKEPSQQGEGEQKLNLPQENGNPTPQQEASPASPAGAQQPSQEASPNSLPGENPPVLSPDASKTETYEKAEPHTSTDSPSQSTVHTPGVTSSVAPIPPRAVIKEEHEKTDGLHTFLNWFHDPDPAPGAGLAPQDINWSIKTGEDGKPYILVSGYVNNPTNEQKEVPRLQIIAYGDCPSSPAPFVDQQAQKDQTRCTLQMWDYTLPEKKILRSEKLPFKTSTLFTGKGKVRWISINFK